MESLTTRKQKRQQEKWEYDIGSRPIWWLLDRIGEDRFVAINRDLVVMILEAMSPGHLVMLSRLIVRR